MEKPDIPVIENKEPKILSKLSLSQKISLIFVVSLIITLPLAYLASISKTNLTPKASTPLTLITPTPTPVAHSKVFGVINGRDTGTTPSREFTDSTESLSVSIDDPAPISKIRSWIGFSNCPSCPKTQMSQTFVFPKNLLVVGQPYSIVVYPATNYYPMTSAITFDATLSQGTVSGQLISRSPNGFCFYEPWRYKNPDGSPACANTKAFWKIDFTPSSDSDDIEVKLSLTNKDLSTNYLYLDAYEVKYWSLPSVPSCNGNLSCSSEFIAKSIFACGDNTEKIDTPFCCQASDSGKPVSSCSTIPPCIAGNSCSSTNVSGSTICQENGSFKFCCPTGAQVSGNQCVLPPTITPTATPTATPTVRPTVTPTTPSSPSAFFIPSATAKVKYTGSLIISYPDSISGSVQRSRSERGVSTIFIDSSNPKGIISKVTGLPKGITVSPTKCALMNKGFNPNIGMIQCPVSGTTTLSGIFNVTINIKTGGSLKTNFFVSPAPTPTPKTTIKK